MSNYSLLTCFFLKLVPVALPHAGIPQALDERNQRPEVFYLVFDFDGHVLHRFYIREHLDEPHHHLVHLRGGSLDGVSVDVQYRIIHPHLVRPQPI